MTELDEAISKAFDSEGKKEDVNKVYLTLLRTPLIIPVEKMAEAEISSDEEPFKPLFARLDDKYFMLAFDTLERLKDWANDQVEAIDFVEISGRDLIAGVNEGVYLCLNVGSKYYKEFSPDEVKQLKKVVERIDQLKS